MDSKFKKRFLIILIFFLLIKFLFFFWNSDIEKKKFPLFEEIIKGRKFNKNCEIRYKHSIEIPQQNKIQLSNSKFYIAMNLVNIENLIPIFFSELTELIYYLKNLTEYKSNSVFISFFESGSIDKTKEFLKFFASELKNLDIEHEIIANDSLVRKSNQRRIDFLAKLRNKVMEPFYLKPKNYFDYVIFFNDVFFCYEDVIRLILHNADLSCGFDFDWMGNHPSFRDTWVSRDIDGSAFSKNVPFAKHPLTVQRFVQGLPASVYCCWNGLVVINASVFYNEIHFRDANITKNECLASEISFFCQDMWNKNFSKIVMDPHVRLAYREDVYEKLNSIFWSIPSFFSLKPWIIEKDIPFFERPSEWTCCNLLNMEDNVDFTKCFQQKIP